MSMSFKAWNNRVEFKTIPPFKPDTVRGQGLMLVPKQLPQVAENIRGNGRVLFQGSTRLRNRSPNIPPPIADRNSPNSNSAWIHNFHLYQSIGIPQNLPLRCLEFIELHALRHPGQPPVPPKNRPAFARYSIFPDLNSINSRVLFATNGASRILTRVQRAAERIPLGVFLGGYSIDTIFKKAVSQQFYVYFS